MTEETFIKENKYDVPYIDTCDNCGKTHKLYTQDDNRPEYHTQVYIVCECDNIVEFNLPVN